MALFDITDLTDDNLMTAEERGGDDELVEYGIDYSTGQLTGKMVYGSEALAVWAWLALQTVRYESMFYSDDYGCELQSLIGERYSREYYESLVRAMITECVTQHELISGITEFECEIGDTFISAHFELVTEAGNEELDLEVDIDV